MTDVVTVGATTDFFMERMNTALQEYRNGSREDDPLSLLVALVEALDALRDEVRGAV